MRCVIADPSASMRRILRNTLHRFGIEDIVDAPDGKQALEACDPTVSLLITSWTADGVDGVELAKQLRANPDTAKIPILMVTDRNSKDDVIAARQAGVSEYMLKPFVAEQLRIKLERLSRAAASLESAATAGQEERLASTLPTPSEPTIGDSASGAPAASAPEPTPKAEASPLVEEERKAA
jgi:two-component system chemotaxis response regulator CheY